MKYLLYIAVFLIPVWFLPIAADAVELSKLVLVSVVAGAGLILWLINLMGGGNFTLRSKRVTLGVLFFGLALILSAIFALNGEAAVLGLTGGYSSSLMALISLMVIFFLIIGPGVIKKDALRNVVVASVFAALLYGTLQLFGVHILPFDIADARNFNTVGTVNSLAILGVMAFPLLFVSVKSLKMKIFYAATGLMTLFLVAVTNWWIVWLPLFAGLSTMVLMRIRQNEQWGKYISLPLIVIICSAVLVFAGMNPFGNLKQTLPLEIAPSWNASREIMEDALSGNPTRLAFGYGPENFRYVYDLYRPARISATMFSDISFLDGTSELVNIVAGMGAIGIAAFLLMLGMFLTTIIKGFRSVKNHAVLPAFAAAVTAFLVYPFNITLYAVFWIILAMTVMTYAKDKIELDLNKSNLYSALSSSVFTLVVVAVIAGLYFSVTMLAADIHFKSALTKADITESINGIMKAREYNPRNDNYAFTLEHALLTAINQEINSGKSQEQINANVQRIMAKSVEVAKSVTDRNPHNSQNWLNRGFVYENLLGFIDGADTWAVKMYDEALARKPGDPLAISRIGRTYLRSASLLNNLLVRIGKDNPQAKQVADLIIANLAKAEEKFKEALAINGTYGAAIYNLGATYERLGRLVEAANQIEAYKKIRPSDAGIAFELGLLRYRLDQKDQAFSELQRAVSLFPDYSNARWYLALLHEERDELDRAVAHLTRIREHNPENEMVIKKINELNAGITSIPPDEITDMEPLER